MWPSLANTVLAVTKDLERPFRVCSLPLPLWPLASPTSLLEPRAKNHPLLYEFGRILASFDKQVPVRPPHEVCVTCEVRGIATERVWMKSQMVRCVGKGGVKC